MKKLGLCFQFVLFLTCSCSIWGAAKAKQFTLPPDCYDLFYGKAPRIYLCGGNWKLKKIQNSKKDTFVNSYTKNSFDDSSWDNTVVPWSWEQPFPTDWGKEENKDPRVFDRARAWDRRYKKSFSGVGYFRTKFKIPKKYSGMRLLIWFGFVQQDAVVYVNGKKIGNYETFGRYSNSRKKYSLESFQFDITNAVKFGEENTLAVRIYNDGLGGAGIYLTRGGIIQPVYIKVVPQVYLQNVEVIPNVIDSSLKIRCKIINKSKTSKVFAGVLELSEYKSKRYTSPQRIPTQKIKLSSLAIPTGTTKKVFTVKVNNPVLWDSDNPNLYLLKIIDKKGKIAGVARFGFRQLSIKKDKILLNGNVLRLRGTASPIHNIKRCDILAGQYSYIYKEVAHRRKRLNFNFTRSGYDRGRNFLDVCDELGAMVNDTIPLITPTMLSNKWIRKFNKKPPRAINFKTLKINPVYLKKVVVPWLQRDFNHPSVIMLNIANEPYDKPTRKLAPVLNTFYRYLKNYDPSRIIAGYSGRWPIRDEAVETDIYDVHDYAGTGCSIKPYTQIRKSLRGFYKKYVKQYKQVKPMINGEGLQAPYPVPFYIKNLSNVDLKKLQPFTRKKYADALNRISAAYAKNYSRALLTQIFAIQFGSLRQIADWKTGCQKIYARSFKRLIEEHRLSDAVQGFNLHGIAHFSSKSKHLKIPENIIEKANSPLLFVWDIPWRHWFAGEKVPMKLWVINDLPKALPQSVRAQLDVLDSQDKRVEGFEFDVPPIRPGGKRFFTPDFTVSKDLPTGVYKFRMRLVKDKKTISENDYELFILGQKDNKVVIQGKPLKVGIYKIRNAQYFQLRKIFKTNKIKCARLKDWSKLKDLDVLVLAGVNQYEFVDEYKELNKYFSQIQSWIKQGGRLVVLGYMAKSPIPGMPPSSVSRLPGQASGTFADPVIPKHPIFKQLPLPCWYGWNGPKAAICNSIITPLTSCILLRSGSGRIFGMTTAEAKYGKGMVLADLSLGLNKYNTDSVARKYVNNIISYTFGSKWDGRYAIAMTGKGRKISRAKTIKCGPVFFVDMKKQSNRGFKDDISNDRKGGWFDQGKKDLRNFPIGIHKFSGVPFKIINPVANKGKSCIVLAGMQRPWFPKNVTIPVNKKFKRLFFLVTSGWTGHGVVAKIKINYQGGTGYAAQRTLTLIRDKNIADWCSKTDLPGAIRTWNAYNKAGGFTPSVYLVKWKNPEPGIPITHINIESTNRAVPVIIAISGEKL